jgi:hypothetical protein
MKPLCPPDYPERPEAPLLAFGPAFSEEIARSLIAAVWIEDDEQDQDTEVRTAAALTMLEAFHPRDHLECMLAAQAVASHNAIMDLHQKARTPDLPDAITIKLRGGIAQMTRCFSMTLRDLERRQSKPLPARPTPEPGPSTDAPPRDEPPTGPSSDPSPWAVPSCAETSDLAVSDDAPEQREDFTTRPDGTPGSLTAYLPKPDDTPFIPREPVIMWALATRPKPWRMVNTPLSEQPAQAEAPTVVDQPEPGMRGPLDLNERIFTGDAWSRFVSRPFDANAPPEGPVFDDEECIVELELVNTGGDPEAEAERQALMAAHPEGKPIKIFRFGGTKPPDKPPEEE